MKRIIFILAAVFLFSTSPVYAFWIWTPKTGKWVNPKNLPKPNPKEQFEYAKSFYDLKKYEDAKREFEKLLKTYPKSFEASEGQYYIGRIDEDSGDFYAAFKAYQKTIDKYPFSERIKEINEREYKIGVKFMEGEKRKAMGVPLPVENPAIEIFTKVVENSTYGPFAPEAQYKLGLVLKESLLYYEAEEAFTKVMTNYPDNEWAQAAKFQLATVRALVSRGPDYDQGAAADAKGQFEEFVKEHPDAALSKQAEENIKKLNEKDAESAYNIAVFYKKQKEYKSAKIYMQEVIDKYPNSPWAKKAAQEIGQLEKHK